MDGSAAPEATAAPESAAVAQAVPAAEAVHAPRKAEAVETLAAPTTPAGPASAGPASANPASANPADSGSSSGPGSGSGASPGGTREPFDDGVLFEVDPSRRVVKIPGALSPSRAGDFMQCPLMFRLRVIDKIPEAPSIEATRGTLVHSVLDRLFDLPAGSRTPDEAAALLGPEWDKLVAERPEVTGLFASPGELEEWLASAKSLLGRYFTLEDPNRLEPARREWFVRAVVGEGEEQLVLRGIVDRLDVSPEGLIRVVDYKTGKSPRRGYEAKNMFQMKFYAVVLWRLRGVVPKRLQLMFLGDGEILTYDPDEQDLQATEIKILAVWDAIRSAVHSGEWPAQPTKLCGWCSFKPICPAHGGEAPPLPVVEITAA